MSAQMLQDRLTTKIDEIKSLIKGTHIIPCPTMTKIAEIGLNNHIIEIHSKCDFNHFLSSYEKANQGVNQSLTGDFFTDHPSLGYEEVDDFVCIVL